MINAQLPPPPRSSAPTWCCARSRRSCPAPRASTPTRRLAARHAHQQLSPSSLPLRATSHRGRNARPTAPREGHQEHLRTSWRRSRRRHLPLRAAHHLRVGAAGGFNFLHKTGAALSSQELASTPPASCPARQRPSSPPFTSFIQRRRRSRSCSTARRRATLGVPINDAFAALSAVLGGSYVNDFNRFGRLYRVFVQSDARSASGPRTSDRSTCGARRPAT